VAFCLSKLLLVPMELVHTLWGVTSGNSVSVSFEVKGLLRKLRGSVCLRLGCFGPAEFILIEIASLLNG